MGEQELKKIAQEKGIETDKPEYSGKGRPPGAYGALPNIKTMGKKDLMTELGKSRKRIKELEEAGRAAGPGGAIAGKPGEDLAIPGELWAFIPTALYDYMASRFGSHWKLKEMEARAYGQAMEKVANRYLPAFAGDKPELFGLVMVMAGTSIPRIMVTIRLKQEAAKEAKAKEPKKDGSDGDDGSRPEGKREKQLDKAGASINP